MKTKKLIAKILFPIVIMCFLCGCASTNTYSAPGTTTANTTILNDNISASPVSEWGFNNIDDFTMDSSDCVLIEVNGYDLTAGYIVCAETPYGIHLKDGLLSTIGQIQMPEFSYIIKRGPYEYIINSNDVITFAGNGSVMIQKRITSDTYDWVVFETNTRFADSHTRYYVPSTIIDFSAYYTDLDGNSGYKLIP